MDLANFRRVYDSAPFDIADADPDPFTQFERWFGEVAAVDAIEANAVVLATASADGRPSARYVLVKGVEEGGFTFFTNYRSRKAAHLAENPAAALVFAWAAVHRQVVVEGAVTQVSAEASDAYFATRPLGSQLGAWASPQSEVLDTRAALDDAAAAAAARYGDGPVPRPPHWGGYRLVPDRIEFWQGRPSRLHDRVVYLPDGRCWQRVRLAP